MKLSLWRPLAIPIPPKVCITPHATTIQPNPGIIIDPGPLTVPGQLGLNYSCTLTVTVALTFVSPFTFMSATVASPDASTQHLITNNQTFPVSAATNNPGSLAALNVFDAMTGELLDSGYFRWPKLG